MQFRGHELMCGSQLCLSPGPLFVTRNGSTTAIYHGGLQRWKAVRIASVRIRWKWDWQVHFCGEGLAVQMFGSVTSEEATFLAFKGAIGHMIIGGTERANVHVSQTRVGSYTFEVSDLKHTWRVLLAGQRTHDGDVTVEILCNGTKVISAPSRHETWTEGVCSVGGFVRHKWGDWLGQSQETLPLSATVASLCCVAFHNSVMGDLLVSDNPVG